MILFIGIHLGSAVFFSITSLKYSILILIFLFQFLIVYLNQEKPELLKLTIIGITAGFIELIADFFLVSTGSLKYNPTELFIWKSPIYMPIIWNFIIFEIGYITIRLDEKMGRTKNGILTGILAVLFVGGMEVLAFYYGLWWYGKTSLVTINHIPLYIFLGEGLMFSTLIFVVVNRKIRSFSKFTSKINWLESTLFKKVLIWMDKGLIFGFIILLCYLVSYYFLKLFPSLT